MLDWSLEPICEAFVSLVHWLYLQLRLRGKNHHSHHHLLHFNLQAVLHSLHSRFIAIAAVSFSSELRPVDFDWKHTDCFLEVLLQHCSQVNFRVKTFDQMHEQEVVVLLHAHLIQYLAVFSMAAVTISFGLITLSLLDQMLHQTFLLQLLVWEGRLEYYLHYRQTVLDQQHLHRLVAADLLYQKVSC